MSSDRASSPAPSESAASTSTLVNIDLPDESCEKDASLKTIIPIHDEDEGYTLEACGELEQSDEEYSWDGHRRLPNLKPRMAKPPTARRRPGGPYTGLMGPIEWLGNPVR
jgi:hypothetical protein